jgi:hypothetical protein
MNEKRIDELLKKRKKMIAKNGVSFWPACFVSLTSEFIAGLTTLVLIIALVVAMMAYLIQWSIKGSEYAIQSTFMSESAVSGWQWWMFGLVLSAALGGLAMFLGGRTRLSEASVSGDTGGCTAMNGLVGQNEYVKLYRDGVVGAGLPLLNYDVDVAKCIVHEYAEDKEAEKRRQICQKAHGFV